MPLFGTKRKPKRTGYQQMTSQIPGLLNKKLGISSDAPREKIIFELNKLKYKVSLRKILNITQDDYNTYGID